MPTMPPVEIRTPTVLERPWGEEILIAWSPIHAGKLLKMRAGTKGGLQYHRKEEHQYLLDGRLLLRTVDAAANEMRAQVLEAGACWSVPPGAIHQEEALTDCTIIEVSDAILNDRQRCEGLFGPPSEEGLPSTPPLEVVERLTKFTKALVARVAQCQSSIEKASWSL